MSIPSLTGKTCPFCQTPIKSDAEVVTCSACGMPHHQECWQENRRCTTFGCTGAPSLSPDAGRVQDAPPPPMAASLPPPPQMAVSYAPAQAPIPQDLYIEGNNILVVRDGASLPPVCIASRKTKELIVRKRTEAWAPPWVVIIALFSPLICLIVYLCVKKTGRINFYLERECAATRTKLLIGIWALFAVTLIGAIAAFSNDATVVLGVFLIIASLFAPLILYLAALQLYTIQKIDNGYVWIKFRKPETAQALYAAYLVQQRM